MRIAGFLLFVLLMVAGSRAELAQTVASGQSATPNPSPVLVELFTSEGCSTCPPADKLLTELDQNQLIKGVEVIALMRREHSQDAGWKTSRTQ